MAVVTGATSGIGLGIAQAPAADGHQAIERLQKDVAKAHGVKVSHSRADMTKPAEIAGMIETATWSTVMWTSW